MSAAQTEAKPAKQNRAVPPFEIEADHPTNSDLLLQGVAHKRLRSRITAARTFKDQKTGEDVVPDSWSQTYGKLPQVPGMRLYVDPAKCFYRISDPLAKDPDLAQRLEKRFKELGWIGSTSAIKPAPVEEGTLDKHRFKTLVREMVHLLDAGEARLVSGPRPSLDDADDLDGEYLLNPGSVVRNSQPTFERDFEEWWQNLDRHR